MIAPGRILKSDLLDDVGYRLSFLSRYSENSEAEAASPRQRPLKLVVVVKYSVSLRNNALTNRRGHRILSSLASELAVSEYYLRSKI